MFEWKKRALCATLCVFGVWSCSVGPPQGETVAVEARAAVSLVPGQRFTIDVRGLGAHFYGLTLDERPEQIADWALFGTLTYSGIDPGSLRDAVFDRSPIRFASLEETLNYDYGPGRHAMIGDDEVWLLYSAFDPAREATLARQADAARAAQGPRPRLYRVFQFRSDIMSGAIDVVYEADITSEAMFSPSYGYHEARVSGPEPLASWLGSIDDLTHVLDVGGGTVEIGGRRHAGSRTRGIELADVAALFQAHKRLDTERKEILAAGEAVVRAWNALIEAHNENVSRFNRDNGAGLDIMGVRSRWSAVRSLLGSPGGSLGDGPSGSPSDNKRWMDGVTAEIGRLEPKIESAAKAAVDRAVAEAIRRGTPPHDAPGFSLDPQWDVPGLIQSLSQLIEEPGEIVARAREVEAAWRERGVDESAKPAILWAAEDVMELLGGDGSYVFPAQWRSEVRASIAGVRGKHGRDAEEGALLPYYRLVDAVQQELGGKFAAIGEGDLLASLAAAVGALEASQTAALLKFIEAEHRVQCARYDGPLQGTRVGMNLFYTDLMAKVWAAVDYHRKAPVAEIDGLRVMPRESVEPMFWAEDKALPATRLWFGPREDALGVTADAEIDFSHIAARVYAAGSNPLLPGKEQLAAESSRRVLNWWDRHYGRIAEHEPEYHVQNQIMKWSLVTGWMVEHGLLGGLADVPVERSHSFDEWYAAHDELRFRDDVRLLPRSRWIGDTECMEILRSYAFPSGPAGTNALIEGGVSLAGESLLREHARIDAAIAAPGRRAGMKFADSIGTSVKGTKFERPAVDGGVARTVILPPETARLRAGGVEAQFARVEFDIAAREQGGSLAVKTDRGTLGELSFERSGTTVSMRWRDGALLADAGRLGKVAEAQSRLFGGAEQLAREPGFGPRDGVFVLDGEDGVEVAVAEEDAIRLLEPRDDARGSLRTAAVTENEGALRTVGARPLGASELEERLAAMPWQRLEPQGMAADHVLARVFTREAPGEGGRPVRLVTGDPALPGIDAVVQDGALHLLRPGGAGKEFDEVVSRQGLDGDAVARIVRDVEQGAEVDAIRLLDGKLARAFERGDLGAAARHVMEASAQGDLDEQLEELKRVAARYAVAGLRAGEASDWYELFTRGLGESTPDGLIVAAMAEVRRGDVSAAADHLNRAARQGTPSQEVLAAADEALPGSSRVRAAFDAGGPPANGPPPVFFKPSRQTLHSVMPLDAKGVRTLDEDERARLAGRSDVVVYVEDTPLLGQHDWDAAPRRTLSEVAREPRVAWAELDDSKVRAVGPDRLAVNGREYVRRTGGSAGPGGGGLPPFAPIVLIGDCDENEDGIVDDAERAACF